MKKIVITEMVPHVFETYGDTTLVDLNTFLNLPDDMLSEITEFHISCNSMGMYEHNFQALGTKLANCAKLVKISCTSLSDLNTLQRKASLLDAIAKCPTLESLDLSNSRINTWEEISFNELCYCLPTLKLLKSLSLELSGLESLSLDQLRKICNTMLQCQILEEIDLSRINFKNLSASASQSLSDMFSTAPALHRLKLRDIFPLDTGIYYSEMWQTDDSISPESLNKLCAPLTNFQNLDFIDLSSNALKLLSVEQIQIFFDSFSDKLKEIDLSRTLRDFMNGLLGCSSEQIHAAFNALTRFPKLEKINLSENSLGKLDPDSFDALCTGLLKLKNLITIEGLDDNNVLSIAQKARLEGIVKSHYHERITESVIQLHGKLEKGNSLPALAIEKILTYTFPGHDVKSADKPVADLFKRKALEEQAQEKNNFEAHFKLGICYRDGIGVPNITREQQAQNEKKAFDWFTKSAAQNYAPAQVDLGNCYKDGIGGIPIDLKTAVKYYKLAAEQGFAPAQFNLGICYEDGIGGIPRDLETAVKYYKLAAAQNYAPAQFNLGYCYQYGLGGIPNNTPEEQDQNLQMAITLYRKSAEQNFAPAQRAIDRMARDQQSKGLLLFRVPKGNSRSKDGSLSIEQDKNKPGSR